MKYTTRPTSTRRPRQRLFPGATAIALGGTLALTLSACGTPAEQPEETAPTQSTSTVTTSTEASEASEEQPTPTEQSSPVTTPISDIESTVEPMGDPGTGDQWIQPEGPWDLAVTGVRIGSHEGFDRVVFDLEGEGTPGWFTTYTTEPTQQASGLPLDYTGEIALLVGIEGTPYPNDSGLPPPPEGTTQGSGKVNMVSYTSLFEARTEFVIGLQDKMPYSVTVLEYPKRLVIDFVHN